MRFQNIEVNGIENIVFNRNTHWRLVKADQWARFDTNLQDERLVSVSATTKSHSEMMKIVNELKTDRRYRMWVHYDTLNIVRRFPKGTKYPKRPTQEEVASALAVIVQAAEG